MLRLMLMVCGNRGVRIVCTMIVAWRIPRRQWLRGGIGSVRCACKRVVGYRGSKWYGWIEYEERGERTNGM